MAIGTDSDAPTDGLEVYFTYLFTRSPARTDATSASPPAAASLSPGAIATVERLAAMAAMPGGSSVSATSSSAVRSAVVASVVVQMSHWANFNIGDEVQLDSDARMGASQCDALLDTDEAYSGI